VTKFDDTDTVENNI